jgi:hypothetical protein
MLPEIYLFYFGYLSSGHPVYIKFCVKLGGLFTHCNCFAEVVNIECFIWTCITECTVCPPHTYPCSAVLLGPSWPVILLELLFAVAGGSFTNFTVILTGVVSFCVSHMKIPHFYRSIFSCFTSIYVVLNFMPRTIFFAIVPEMLPSVCLSICLSIYLSVYLYIFDLWLYSLLLDLGRFFSFVISSQSAGLLGRGISSSQGLYINTE